MPWINSYVAILDVKSIFFNSAYSTLTITGSVFKVFNLVSLQDIGIYSFLMSTLGRVMRCFYSPKMGLGSKEEKWKVSYSENPIDSSSFASWINCSCLGNHSWLFWEHICFSKWQHLPDNARYIYYSSILFVTSRYLL